MSLLFEHALNEFSVNSATLVSVESNDLQTTNQKLPVQPVAEFASHHDSLSHPNKEWVCIPLHKMKSAVPTGDYVGYLNHDLRGELFYVADNGSQKRIPADEFAQTKLARRIRFWHSDFLPNTFPPGYNSPINDHEPPRNPVDSESLLDEFESYITAEREAAKTRNRERTEAASPQTRLNQGEAVIPAVTCVDEENGQFEFRVELDNELQAQRDDNWAYFVENEFGIHQNNEILLHVKSERTGGDFPVTGTVDRIRGLSLWISFDWTGIDSPASVRTILKRDCEFSVSVLLNPVPFERELDAVEDLRDSRVRDILIGAKQLTFSNSAAARTNSFDTDLNQEQQAAVKYALLADELFCIHGPPGTGKTRTLIEIIRRAVEAGDTVLVCADSNQAVDNLVAGGSTMEDVDPHSLHAHSQHGNEEFVLDRVNAGRSANPLIRRSYGDVNEDGTPEVVAATNSSAAKLHREFDLLVLDEATQSTCTASCVPLSRSDRIVLAGDHHQLPPFSSTEEPPESSYGLSLFEHLYADDGVYEGVGIQLKTQYRMHQDIAYFPNREFYGQTLRNGQRIQPLHGRPPIEAYNIGGPVEIIDHSRANENEAKLVAHLVDQLVSETNLSPVDIGIITPYSAQVKLLNQWITDTLPGTRAVEINTIDAYQGSEKTAIIVSLVRSNSDGEIGFLGRAVDGPRRLNVALTRGQRYTAVVGDFHTLRYNNERKQTDVYQKLTRFFEETGRINQVDPQLLPS